ncbi:aminopeptidase [Chitinimonas sp. BJYL2]|uniref:aminopeptidase n=1 Tax=Chitinimonas sp. BJYL2 TaxID=2976696 RepID=UPI0022B59200|nr:aminopeptidase [Chitinimonas sp. BJYL2]
MLIVRTLLLLSSLLLISGCANLGYLAQAARGQAEVLDRARPIDDWLADPDLPAETVRKLRLVQQLRRFAVTELDLPDNASYTRYADLQRPFVLWNVVSTPELSLVPVQSCFPVAGCLTYRGYYDEAEARRYAQQREQAGEDVYLYGIPAYSTLGWFADPLLNTTLRLDDLAIARLIFHELAHQRVYVRDDTAFNEAYATAVEQEGLARWLTQHGNASQRLAAEQSEQRRQQVLALMNRGRARLSALYASASDDETKRQGKQRIQSEVAVDYAALKQSSGSVLGYDSWFRPAPNNAHFASISTYHALVPALRALFRSHGSDFPAFHAAVKLLAQQPAPERQASLAMLVSQPASDDSHR